MRNKKKAAALMMAAVLCTVSMIPVSAAQSVSSMGSLEEKDTDKDGLADYIEQYYKTDKNKKDTDGDGISDYDEIMLYNTNPLKKDTDGNGISDYNEDYDGDGLTVKQEMKYGTDPMKADTDGDGILDGKEIKKYHSNPLKSDSDSDGLEDGLEVTLKMNPIKKDTDQDGVLDSEEMVTRKITAGSTKSDVYAFAKADVKAKNYLKPQLTKLEKDDLEVGSDIPGYLGNGFLFTSDGACKNVKLVIGFQKQSSEANPAVYYFDETEKKLIEATAKKRGTEIQVSNVKEGKYVLLDKNKYEGIIKRNSFAAAKAMTATDTVTDSNNDGISDYYTTLIFEGKILTGTGKSYAGYDFSGANGDYDGDGLLNGKEMQVVTDSNEIYLKVTTDPTISDTDFDGREDAVDTDSFSNSFSGTLKTSQAATSVSYVMDYRNFFKSISSYNKNVCTMSSICSSLTYSGSTIDGSSISTFLRTNGLASVRKYQLNSKYKDNDITDIYVGHRKVTYNGITREILGIFVRGTNGSIEEWSSNFDVGKTSDFNKNNDWVIKTNHKGFDITATRILNYVDTYKNTYLDSSVDTAYWVTGHSRGAAIANIIGARLYSEGKTAYTYTFAAPNTTTASNPSTYKGIYNIVNTDDLVPQLPMEAWGFVKYGKTYKASIAGSYEKEWEKLTGISDYNPDTFGLSETVDKMGAIAANRDACYTFVYAKDYYTSKFYSSESTRDSKLSALEASYPASTAGTYKSVKQYKSSAWVNKYGYYQYQTPAFLMQILAAVMAGQYGGSYDLDFATLDVAPFMEDAKWGIIRTALGGVEHPHYPESYYLLSTHAVTTLFA